MQVVTNIVTVRMRKETRQKGSNLQHYYLLYTKQNKYAMKANTPSNVS